MPEDELMTAIEALMLPLNHPKIKKAIKEVEAVWDDPEAK